MHRRRTYISVGTMYITLYIINLYLPTYQIIYIYIGTLYTLHTHTHVYIYILYTSVFARDLPSTHHPHVYIYTILPPSPFGRPAHVTLPLLRLQSTANWTTKKSRGGGGGCCCCSCCISGPFLLGHRCAYMCVRVHLFVLISYNISSQTDQKKAIFSNTYNIKYIK